MLGVVCFGQPTGGLHHLQGTQLEALELKSGYYLPNQAALNTVGLDCQERALGLKRSQSSVARLGVDIEVSVALSRVLLGSKAPMSMVTAY